MANHLIHPKFLGAYVYAILVDGVVRYIGKGRRYRATDHYRIARELNRRRGSGEKVRAKKIHNKLAKEMRRGAVIGHEVIANGMTDAQAYAREIEEIAKVPVGQLWNVKKGGNGGDADMMRAFWADPEYRERTRRNALATMRSAEFRERARKTAKGYWDDPEYYARQVAREKAIWADPQKRAARIAILKRVWADPEKSKRKSALVKSQWTPERRAAMAENRRKAWADPEFKRRVMANVHKAMKESRARRPRKSRSVSSAQLEFFQE